MALVALVIGLAVSAAATERVTLSLVLTSALAWAFVPVIQLGTGCWLVRTAAPGRRVAALERYFATHRPWSMSILGFHALMLGWAPARGYALLLLPLIAIPIAMTVRSLTNLCREFLGMPAGQARRAVAVHQGMTYAVVAAYAAWASAYLPRIVGLFS
jgi:hypothetical protein